VGRAHAAWSFSLSAGTAVGAGAAWLSVPVLVQVGVTAVVAIALQLGVWWHTRDDLPADADVAPETEETGADTRGADAVRGKVRALLLILAVAAIAASYVESPGQEWTALLLSRGFGASPGLAATGPLMFSVGLLISRLMLDPLTKNVPRSVIARVAGATIAVGMTLGLLVAAPSSSTGQALVVIALAGIGAGPVFPLLFGGAEILSRRYSVPRRRRPPWSPHSPASAPSPPRRGRRTDQRLVDVHGLRRDRRRRHRSRAHPAQSTAPGHGPHGGARRPSPSGCPLTNCPRSPTPRKGSRAPCPPPAERLLRPQALHVSMRYVPPGRLALRSHRIPVPSRPRVTWSFGFASRST
jgi:hypothetical protein